MNFDTLRATLETAFSAGWGITTPIAWQNSSIQLPNSLTPWVRFSLAPGASLNVVLGSDVPRLRGFIAIQVFIPLDQGVGDGYRLSDTILSILENKNFSGIFTYAGFVDNVGEGIRRVKDVETGFHQLNVKIPYEAQ